MQHLVQLDPASQPAVSENLNRAMLTVELMSASGDVYEFQLTLDDAERLATRLRDCASAVHTFVTAYGRRVDGAGRLHQLEPQAPR